MLLAETDPRIITSELAEAAPADPGARKPSKQKAFRAVSVRLRKGESLFGSTDEEDVLGRVKSTAAVVLSHSCDVDRRTHICFGRVSPMSPTIPERDVAAVRSRDAKRSLSYFYLPPDSRLPEAVVNLDVQFSLSSDMLGKTVRFESRREQRAVPALVPYEELIESRVASLNEAGLRLLYERMFRRAIRPEEMTLTWDPSVGVFDDDPDRPTTQTRRGWWWPTPKWLRPDGSSGAKPT